MRFTFTLKDIKTNQLSEVLKSVSQELQHMPQLTPADVTGISKRIGEYRRALPSNLRSEGVTLVLQRETE